MASETLEHLVEAKVVCPHCWHNFFPDQALYITQHPELFGDPVLGDAKRRYARHEVRTDRDGQVLDPKGWPMLERACPRCRLQIPTELLAARPRFLSVVGAPRSGKTYFLTAMLHFLRRDLPAHFNFALDISDSHDATSYVDYVNQLFYPADGQQLTYLEKTTVDMLVNRVRLNGAEVMLPKPFIFNLRVIDEAKRVPAGVKSRRRTIVLYDNPGEAYEFQFDREGGTSRHTQHLAEADAVLFAFDPLLDAQARDKLKTVSADPQLDSLVPQRQENVLSAVINRIRRYRNLVDGTRIETPLAVCVQKFDVWNKLLAHRQVIDNTSVVNFRSEGIAALDVQEVNAASLLVRRFLEDLCPLFVATAEANFRTVRYFPVSALGISPTADGPLLKVRPYQIQPFRVTHPLLWLCQRWQLIFATKSRVDNPKQYPIAEVREATRDRIVVVTPGGNRLALDREYAASWIVDPVDGTLLWVPAVGEAAAAQPAAPPRAVTPPPRQTAPPPSVPPADLRLKLDDPRPAPPRKSGWFRRSE